jgi:hypothetical protein
LANFAGYNSRLRNLIDIITLPTRTLDIAYHALMRQARSLGYTMPTPSYRHKHNKLLKALKYSGVWAKCDVIWVFLNNGSKEFATLNWKNPTANQITIVNSCAWAAATGFTGNATDMHLDTNFNPATQGVNYVLDNASRFGWLLADNSNMMDGIAGSGLNTVIPSSSTAQRINQSGNSLNAAADLNGTGLTAINRTSSTNVELFKNTTQLSRTATSTSVTSANQLILRSNTSYGSHSIACYGMGASLVNENTGLFNALNAFIATL